ncbi:MAG TPA: hypothetical protein VMW10_00540 [Alphaproteobacteria bacterium]|nr:hypothetical protein [Alphaproteobacteria bacterium]
MMNSKSMKGGDAYKPFQAESRGGSPLPGSNLERLEKLSKRLEELKASKTLNAEQAIFFKLLIPELADIYIQEGKVK